MSTTHDTFKEFKETLKKEDPLKHQFLVEENYEGIIIIELREIKRILESIGKPPKQDTTPATPKPLSPKSSTGKTRL